MKKTFILLLAAFTPWLNGASYAQEAENPVPSQTLEEVKAASEKRVSNAVDDVNTRAQEYVLRKKGQLRKQGRSNEVFVSYGAARVNAKGASPDWGDSRIIAYQRAQMDAREKLLKTLYSEVTSEIVKDSFKTNKLPKFEPEELQSQSKLESLLDKLTALADATLDEKLSEKGIDPAEYNAAPPEKRKIMMKKAFSKTTERLSRGDLSGTLVTRTFETTDENGYTAVAVVIQTSVKMKNLLSELRVSKGAIEPNPNKKRKSIDDFLIENRKNLMYEYGLKLMYDEQGYPILLSFAQAGNDCNPVDYEECVDNREFAYIEAENDAFAHIAEAYNLSGLSKTSTSKGEEQSKEARVTQTAEGEETIQETVSRVIKETRAMAKMTSSVKNLVGIEEAMRWSEKHPVTGREINGLVLAWHPLKEQAIRTFKAGKIPSNSSTSEGAVFDNGSGSSTSSMELMDDSDF
ncbi:hypothetical protein GCM10023116_32270 [Kistimonas scapharcae]|uniref:DUF6844 domain-containing protein n=1 Tax=Kistimonas scapharcae TaxID=1036133 RepID=A0ABP8V5Y3_9GAMM